MQKELDKFKGMQEGLQKDYEARMGLIAQQQETELVKQEFDSIEEDAIVYKLVGPVMVKQNVDDAKANVVKRLEYISGELDRSNKIIAEKEKDLGDKQKQLIKDLHEMEAESISKMLSLASCPAKCWKATITWGWMIGNRSYAVMEDIASVSSVRSATRFAPTIFLAALATIFLAGQEAPIVFSSLRNVAPTAAGDRLSGSRTARRAEVQELEEELEEEEDEDALDVDLDKDPNWLKVKQEMVRIWDIRYEDEDWLIADDVKGIMDEHLQTIIGKVNYLELEETFVEVAEDEPKPGEISKEDFAEIAGAYVYGTLYRE
ncbi:YKE2 [Symbiodinium natans]|uniref:YKE2 protein n=1 Tax=Symbiodinium natans TaxID=878477 RepID=A0A812KCF5_9DINO|nr:YKE2 [Symbiodinium natans]